MVTLTEKDADFICNEIRTICNDMQVAYLRTIKEGEELIQNLTEIFNSCKDDLSEEDKVRCCRELDKLKDVDDNSNDRLKAYYEGKIKNYNKMIELLTIGSS